MNQRPLESHYKSHTETFTSKDIKVYTESDLVAKIEEFVAKAEQESTSDNNVINVMKYKKG